MDKYKIAETENYSKKVNSKKCAHLYQKILDDVYPILRKNPFFGVNIKKLKGAYKDIYRFRIGSYRLFYRVEERELIVFMIGIKAREGAYK